MPTHNKATWSYNCSYHTARALRVFVRSAIRTAGTIAPQLGWPITTIALMPSTATPGQVSALFPSILPAIYMSQSDDPMTVSRQNAVIHAATLINFSTVIETSVKDGKLTVVPAVYDVATSKVELLPIPAALRQKTPR